jgi:hypothetical protein
MAGTTEVRSMSFRKIVICAFSGAETQTHRQKGIKSHVQVKKFVGHRGK